MPKFMVIDGNSIANRAFYGIRMLNAPDGTPTNAVFGFISIVQRLMELEQPDALCVCFDVHAPTFRHEMYNGYKAQRKPMPPYRHIRSPRSSSAAQRGPTRGKTPAAAHAAPRRETQTSHSPSPPSPAPPPHSTFPASALTRRKSHALGSLAAQQP